MTSCERDLWRRLDEGSSAALSKLLEMRGCIGSALLVLRTDSFEDENAAHLQWVMGLVALRDARTLPHLARAVIAANEREDLETASHALTALLDLACQPRNPQPQEVTE